MKEYIMQYKKMAIFSIILVTIMVVASLLQPKVLSTIINEGIMNIDSVTGVQNPDMDIITKYGVILIVLALVALVAGIINTVLSAVIAQKSTSNIRAKAFEKIQTFSYADIEAFNPSNIVVRLTNDLTQVQSLIMMMFQSLFRIPLLFIGSFILAITVMPSLWWIIIVEIVVIVIMFMVVSKFTFPKFGKFQKQLDSINTTIKENFEGVRVIKSFVKEDYEVEKFSKKSNDFSKLNFGIGKNFAILMPLIMFIANIAVVLVLYFSKDLASNDISIIGDVMSFINYLQQILMALLIGGTLMMQAGRAITSKKRVDEILNFEPSLTFEKDGVKELKGNVEFKNVSFKYPNDDEHSLEDISFKISAGETIGVVGATGSGKSTLVNLISRLFDADSGEILLDGVNIKKVPKNTLRNDISTVLQKPILFSGTIINNIKEGKLDASLDEVDKSAELAQAKEFISTMGLGYESEVLERGVNFSGGQKQRLSIARGLIKDPAILILDDSTSALDAKSERLVKEALDTSLNKCTKIIISQKISSVVDASQILVLDEGKLIATGTHKELVKTCDIYKEIFESQKGRGE